MGCNIMTIKPPFPWNGAKTRILKDLMSFIEQWDGKGKWIEPFLGTGIVSRQIAKTHPNSQQILGDLNPWLIAAHQYWLSGIVAPPTLDDVSSEKVQYFRGLKDSDFNSISERERALRFLICLYSAWGNRWQTNEDGIFATPINTARNAGTPQFLLRR
jgi:DNA adenine methylase